MQYLQWLCEVLDNGSRFCWHSSSVASGFWAMVINMANLFLTLGPLHKISSGELRLAIFLRVDVWVDSSHPKQKVVRV